MIGKVRQGVLESLKTGTIYISRKTFEFYYGKHYQGYVDKTNANLPKS